MQELNEALFEASKRQRGEQQRAATSVMKSFKQECLRAAEAGRLLARSPLIGFFWQNTGQFSHRWYQDKVFQIDFVALLKSQLHEEFGTNGTFTSASLIGCGDDPAWSDGVELFASWPKLQQSLDTTLHVLPAQSNVTKECPVCLHSTEVIALTPCGHLQCVSCSGKFKDGANCPVCRKVVDGQQSICC